MSDIDMKRYRLYEDKREAVSHFKTTTLLDKLVEYGYKIASPEWSEEDHIYYREMAQVVKDELCDRFNVRKDYR